MKPVVIIACSKRKLRHAATARHLYQGTCFKKSVQWAEQRGLRWLVLSAKYGFVEPDRVVAPYSLTLSSASGKNDGSKMSKPQKAEWVAKVNAEARERFAGKKVVALVGSEYLKALEGVDYDAPLSGMGIGPRVAWLKKEIDSWTPSRKNA